MKQYFWLLWIYSRIRFIGKFVGTEKLTRGPPEVLKQFRSHLLMISRRDVVWISWIGSEWSGLCFRDIEYLWAFFHGSQGLLQSRIIEFRRETLYISRPQADQVMYLIPAMFKNSQMLYITWSTWGLDIAKVSVLNSI